MAKVTFINPNVLSGLGGGGSKGVGGIVTGGTGAPGQTGVDAVSSAAVDSPEAIAGAHAADVPKSSNGIAPKSGVLAPK